MGSLSHTVSGNIASFRTPSRVPIENLKFHFLPKQEGSGDPSPTNVRPITGWTGLNGGGHGINLWDEVWEIGRININNGQNDNNVKTSIRSKNYIPCKPGTKYFIKHSMGTNNLCLFFYDKNKNFISYGWKYSVEVTVPDNCYYLRFYLHNSYGTEYNNDVGINYPSSKTSYVKYTGNKEIPITFPDGETIYGGYYDPIAGEIVAEYKKHIYDGITMQIAMNYRVSDRFYGLKSVSDCQYGSSGHIISNMLKTQFNHGENVCYQRPSDPGYLMDFGRTTICDLSLEEYDALTNQEQVNLVNNYLSDLYENGTPLIVVYKLSTPIHIPIISQDIKAFLDHNNFWSDANDITEVTYEVCDSNMILQTKKNIIAENSKHYRKVLWNQWLPPLDENGWKAYTTSYTTATFSDGIATNTWLTDKSEYSTSIRDKNGTRQYAGEIWYASYMVKTSVPNLQWGLEMCGGNQLRYITSTQTDIWKQCSAVSAYNRGTTNYTYICNLSTADGDQTGIVAQVTSPILVNLTAMFGPGNEPTKKQFEALCKINHVDLTQYQPQTSGIEQIWCIPSINLDDYITVEWNQWAKAINSTNYKAYNANNIEMTISDDIITSTWLKDGSEYSFAICASYTKTHAVNRYYYLSYEYYTDINGYIGGDVGGVTTPYKATQTNQWTRYSTLVKRTDTGNMNNYALYINRFSNTAPPSTGDICKARNIIAIDITQMFGAGNEPKSTAEFEYLCTINNIDLTEYHAYNSGTKIIWKI